MMALYPALTCALHLRDFLQQLRDEELGIRKAFYISWVVPEHSRFPLSLRDRISSENMQTKLCYLQHSHRAQWEPHTTHGGRRAPSPDRAQLPWMTSVLFKRHNAENKVSSDKRSEQLRDHASPDFVL